MPAAGYAIEMTQPLHVDDRQPNARLAAVDSDRLPKTCLSVR
jgi:hypothetical protein